MIYRVLWKCVPPKKSQHAVLFNTSSFTVLVRCFRSKHCLKCIIASSHVIACDTWYFWKTIIIIIWHRAPWHSVGKLFGVDEYIFHFICIHTTIKHLYTVQHLHKIVLSVTRFGRKSVLKLICTFLENDRQCNVCKHG